MSSDAGETIARHVLVLESPKGLETMDLCRRLREIGATSTLAASFGDAQRQLREGARDIGAILIPTHYPADHLARALAALLDDAPPSGIVFVSVGNAPPAPERKKLRKAGVKLALWNPICEAHLRFQINRALRVDREGFGDRDNPRVPTQLGCTITIGAREKAASVYSLAETGAFLATRRASMNGAQIGLQLRLPGESISTRAEVVYANVPGNLQRPGLPLGMGVQFVDLSDGYKKRLRQFIAGCVEQLEV